MGVLPINKEDKFFWVVIFPKKQVRVSVLFLRNLEVGGLPKEGFSQIWLHVIC
jgi:hypothetical protein